MYAHGDDLRRPGRAVPAPHPRPAPRRAAAGRRAGRLPGHESARGLQAPSGAARGGARPGPPGRTAAALRAAPGAVRGGRRVAGAVPADVVRAARCPGTTPRRAGGPLMRDGTLQRRDGEHVLRFERRLSHPIDRVWAALTQPAGLVGWLAEADVDLREGGRIELRWLNHDDAGNSAVAR